MTLVFLRRLSSAFALAASLCFAAPAWAQSPAGQIPQRAEIEAIVKDYLLKNPEVLRDALIELEKRGKFEEEAQRARAVSELAPKIFDSRLQVVVGNPQGKITLVEFFDYNCGYCKRALDDLAALIKKNPDLRVVLKEFPVLGTGSIEAAQVAHALRMQVNGEKYWSFHHKLMSGRGQVGKAQALAAAKDAGADMARLTRDLESAEIRAGLQEAMQIADALGLTGTPSYVIGEDVVVGAVGASELQGRIDNMRSCGRARCS
jgi:protein-disulfide isomerase